MPRTKQQNEEIKKVTTAHIKDVGLRLFAHKGLAATSIADIAGVAGISVGLMYHYYRSKEELYNDLIATAIAESTEGLMRIAELDALPMEKVRLFTSQILDETSSDDRTSLYFILMTQALLSSDLPKKAADQLKNAYVSFDIMTSIIVAGQKDGGFRQGDPAMLTTLFLSSINGLCTYKLILGERFIAPEPEMLMTLLAV